MWVQNPRKDHVFKKYHTFDLSTCTCEMVYGIYLESIISQFPQNIPTKAIRKNYNERKVTCRMENFYVLFALLLIIISLLIIVSIYCYLIKHWSKQKHLLL